LFVSGSTLESAIDVTCDSVSNFVPKVLLNAMFDNITNDYKEGAPALAALNAYDSPVKKACFYGVEYDKATDANTANPKQLVWRTLGMFGKASQGPAFSQDDDSEWVKRANETMAEYQARLLWVFMRLQQMDHFLQCSGINRLAAC
jgi:hypothetical protein